MSLGACVEGVASVWEVGSLPLHVVIKLIKPVFVVILSRPSACLSYYIATHHPRRSTNLDSWTLSQLRIMKVGGNASATDFFTRHGGSSLLTSSDAKARYSSSVAERYKAELEKRKREDEFKCPEGIRIEGVDLNKAVGGTGSGAASRTGTPVAGGKAGEEGGGDDDFFSTWDKTSSKPAAPVAQKPTTSGVPGIGVARPAAGPRTVTSSSLRAGTTGGASTTSGTTKAPSRLGATRLASNTSTTTMSSTTGSAPRASKLGAKRAAAPINFEEAQKRALEEEERVKRLGYDRKKEEEEAKERERKEAEQRQRNAESSRSSTPLGGSSSAARSAVQEKPKPVRLGFGATAATAAAATAGAGAAVAAKK